MVGHIVKLFEEECVRLDNAMKTDMSHLKQTIRGTESIRLAFSVLPRSVMMYWDPMPTQLFVNQLIEFFEELRVFTLQIIKPLKTAIDKKTETLRRLWVSVLRLGSCAIINRRIADIYGPMFRLRALDLAKTCSAMDSMHAYLILVSTKKFKACPRLLQHCLDQSAEFNKLRITATFRQVFEVECFPGICFATQIVELVGGFYKDS
jgi:hypothetical protein